MKKIIIIFLNFILIAALVNGCTKETNNKLLKDGEFSKEKHEHEKRESREIAYKFIDIDNIEDFVPPEKNDYITLSSYDLQNEIENTFTLPYLDRGLLKANKDYLVYCKESYPSGLCIANTKTKKVTFTPLVDIVYDDDADHIIIKDNWIYLRDSVYLDDMGSTKLCLFRIDINSGKKDLIFETDHTYDNIVNHMIIGTKIYMIIKNYSDPNSHNFEDLYMLYSMKLDGTDPNLIYKDMHSCFEIYNQNILAVTKSNENNDKKEIIYKINPYDGTKKKLYESDRVGYIFYADEENILGGNYICPFILFNKNNPKGKKFDYEYYEESGVQTLYAVDSILYQMSSNGKLVKTNLTTGEKEYIDMNVGNPIWNIGFPIWTDKFMSIQNQIINLRTNERLELESLVNTKEGKILFIKDNTVYYKAIAAEQDEGK